MEVAHLVKCWPCKHEDPASIDRTYMEKPSMAGCTCNLSPREMKKGGSLRIS